MTYAIVFLAVWLLLFPAAFIVFHSFAAFLEWLSDRPEHRDA